MQALGLCFVAMTLLLLLGNIAEILQLSPASVKGARADWTGRHGKRTRHDRGDVRIVDFADAARGRGQARRHREHAPSDRFGPEGPSRFIP
jgi:hypothetical protein